MRIKIFRIPGITIVGCLFSIQVSHGATLFERLLDHHDEVTQPAYVELESLDENSKKKLVPPLIDALTQQAQPGKDSNAEDASFALLQLGSVAVPALIKTMTEDPRENARYMATSVFEHMDSTPQIISALIVVLQKDKSVIVLQTAADALAHERIKARRAVPTLVELMGKTDSTNLSSKIDNALELIGPPAVPDLRKLISNRQVAGLKKNEGNQVLERIKVLYPKDWNALESPDASWPLAQRILSNNGTIRWIATEELRALDEQGKKEVIKKLIGDLENPDIQVRQLAASALTGAKLWPMAPGAIPYLLNEMRTIRNGIGSQELAAMGPTAVPVLIELLQTNDIWIQGSAADTLRMMGPTAVDSVPALIEAMKAHKENDRGSFAVALNGVGTPEALAAVKKYGHDWDESTAAKPQQSSTFLHVVRPKNGVTVNAGDKITIVIDVNKRKKFAAINAIGQDMAISEPKTSPPYEFSMYVPHGYAGDKKITAMGTTSSGKTEFSESIIVHIGETGNDRASH